MRFGSDDSILFSLWHIVYVLSMVGMCLANWWCRCQSSVMRARCRLSSAEEEPECNLSALDKRWNVCEMVLFFSVASFVLKFYFTPIPICRCIHYTTYTPIYRDTIFNFHRFANIYSIFVFFVFVVVYLCSYSFPNGATFKPILCADATTLQLNVPSIYTCSLHNAHTNFNHFPFLAKCDLVIKLLKICFWLCVSSRFHRIKKKSISASFV